ncbi:uncharacterized protein LOC131624200 [Vicia villosa]|uniref:uncharacterized protein LOC131624200 n=1 Tax=Vicia villosa TaxID=3911 RepID=UPI00273C8BC6|nr:uncharacterized protein LOC131624200 [Vicia villosa]
MAPPKPTNPSSKEIVEEAVQLAQHRLDMALQDTQTQMDERFHMAAAELSQQMGQVHTRFDNERQTANIRYDSIMSILHKISEQRENPQSAIVHSAASGSGITQPPFSSPMVNTAATLINTPVHTPLHTAFNPHISVTQPTVPTPLHRHTAPEPPPPPPFPPNPHLHQNHSAFIPNQDFNATPLQSVSYQTLSQLPPLPTFRSPKLELPLFDGYSPLEWLFQAEQYFSFYNLPPENRLSLVSFYMKGDALGWFKWMHQKSKLPKVIIKHHQINIILCSFGIPKLEQKSNILYINGILLLVLKDCPTNQM